MASLVNIGKFSFQELMVLFEAWFVFLKWDLLISYTRYENWKSEIAKLSGINPSTKEFAAPTSPDQIKKIIKLSETVARHHIRKMNCLRRCLSQKQMLEKRGFNTKMHIGVCIEQEKLKAHAWLSFQGLIINDNEDVSSRYSELTSVNEQAIFSSLK